MTRSLRAIFLCAVLAQAGPASEVFAEKIDDQELLKMIRRYTTPAAEPGSVLLENADPMTQAILRDDLAAVRKLIAEGASLDVPNTVGMTPLMTACNMRRPLLARFFLESGAAVNARTPAGFTALVFAAQRGSGPIVDLLVAWSADVDAATDEGLTPLIAAVIQERYAAAEILLRAGADVNLSMKSGVPALDFARLRKNADLEALLQRYGARASGEGDLLVVVG